MSCVACEIPFDPVVFVVFLLLLAEVTAFTLTILSFSFSCGQTTRSYIGAENRRAAARLSWVKQLRDMYRPDASGYVAVETRFFVGSVADTSRMEMVREEQKKHNDLIVINFHDGYNTLGEKVPKYGSLQFFVN